MTNDSLASPHSEATPFSQRLFWLGLVGIVALGLWVAAINYHDTYDDAFIIFRYAHNFATGKGYVFNPGDHHLGLTAPLYGLVLGILGIPKPSAIPLIAGVLSSISLMAAGVGLFMYAHLHKKTFVGFVAGAMFIVNYLLIHTFGGEMLTLVALVVWSFTAAKMEKRILSAGLMAAAVLVRPDAIIAAAVLGVYLWISTGKFPLKEALTGFAILVPFILSGWVYYGSPLPDTLAARQAQGASGNWPLFVQGLENWVKGLTNGKSAYTFLQYFPDTFRYLIFIGIGVLGLVIFRLWLPFIGWVALFLLGYALLDVPFYHWYVVPFALAWSLLIATGVATLHEIGKYVIHNWLPEAARMWTGYVMSAVLLFTLVPGVIAQMKHMRMLSSQQPDPAEILYENAGRWFAANTPEEATVGYLEIGYFGFYSERHLIDPLGLTYEDVIPHVAVREYVWAYQNYRPDYIILNPRMTGFNGDLALRPWFKTDYREQIRISEEGYGELIIYQAVEK